MKNVTKNTNVVRISSSIELSNNSFFRYWLDFIKPLHQLSEKDMDVLASFLVIRYELSRNVTDSNLLDSLTLSVENKKIVREAHNLSTSYFQGILHKFKKANIIIDGKINKRLIPNIELDSDEYRLIILFDFKDDNG